ncbi:hypothetical protein BJY01DRAFT_159970 [Aspergillus pseudoustus]|uniref:FAD-binding domain-containing protein n=1 Tax=Aspergillus pseudoustus TaxID=1810923 RepID=A0ABR4K7X3_9EURO
MKRSKVLISGAGIAGNALAFWLSKLGHEITVIERSPQLRTSGLQIDLRGHGIQLLRRMGLESAFRAKAVPELGMQVVDSAGRRQAFFPATKTRSGAQSFTSDFEIMRGDLCRLLYDAIPKERVKYIFGTSVETFEEQGDALQVRFTNGDVDEFDILVGADGLHSRTRAMMMLQGADGKDAFRPLGEYTAYYTIPRPVAQGEEYVATSYIAPGNRFVLTRRNDPNRIQVYMTGKAVTERLDSVKRGDVRGEKKVFVDVFWGAGWEVDGILQSLLETDDFYCESQGLVKLDSWHKGRVVLLGDAACCPSASTGMGTTSAMVGAYILAGEIGRQLRSPGNQCQEGVTEATVWHEAAFQAYDSKFRPFIDQIQKGVGEPSVFDKIPWSPLTIGAAHWVLWFVSCLRLDLFEGLLSDQPVKGWELPEYESFQTGHKEP